MAPALLLRCSNSCCLGRAIPIPRKSWSSILCRRRSLVGRSYSTKAERVTASPAVTRRVIWRAMKLPIYSVALVPISVGSAAAFLQCGAFDASQFLLLSASSFLVVTWLNLSNDAYDAETGVDKDKEESLVNITGSQRGVLYAAYACLALGCLGLCRAAVMARDARVVLLLAASILCGYVYQCPPFRLSYKGVGEPLCFLAFGPFATTAFYLSQSRMGGRLMVTPKVLAASTIVGMTTTLILFCSHFHQIEGDEAVGKMSPLVRLGSERAAEIVHFAVFGLYAALGIFSACKLLPSQCAVLSMLTFPVGKRVVDFVRNHHDDKEKIFLAKYYCVRLHAACGVSMVLGLLLRAYA